MSGGSEKGPVMGPTAQIVFNRTDQTFELRLFNGRRYRLDPLQTAALARGAEANVFDFLSKMLSDQLYSSVILGNLKPEAIFTSPIS